MKIKEVSYEKVFNLGNYQTLRLGCKVEVEEGDSVTQAFEGARKTVVAEFAKEGK